MAAPQKKTYRPKWPIGVLGGIEGSFPDVESAGTELTKTQFDAASKEAERVGVTLVEVTPAVAADGRDLSAAGGGPGGTPNVDGNGGGNAEGGN